MFDIMQMPILYSCQKYIILINAFTYYSRSKRLLLKQQELDNEVRRRRRKNRKAKTN